MNNDIVAVRREDLNNILKELTIIKTYLFSFRRDDEGELTDWAKKELERARKFPRSKNISLEEAKQILGHS